MASSKVPPPRLKRGAQPGNTNAFKHGFYSHSLAFLEDKFLEPDPLAGMADEEILIRMLIYRIVRSMRKRNMPHAGYVDALRAVVLAVGRLQSLHRSRKTIDVDQTLLLRILEELECDPLEEPSPASSPVIP
jgi:hypothetical protein